MFGIGMQEVVLICVIALIVVGPKKLPELARALGKGYGEFRRAFDEMKRSVETDLQTDEIRRSLLDLPPPPPPPAAAAPPQPVESLVIDRPASERTPPASSGEMGGSPAAPERPGPDTSGAPGTSSGPSDA